MTILLHLILSEFSIVLSIYEKHVAGVACQFPRQIVNLLSNRIPCCRYSTSAEHDHLDFKRSKSYQAGGDRCSAYSNPAKSSKLNGV